MKISRRTFINWTGTGLLGTTVAGSIAAHAQEQTTNMRQLALGMPAATGIGRKYDANGKALSFPGNTILCHLRHHPQAYAAMTNIVASTIDDRRGASARPRTGGLSMMIWS